MMDARGGKARHPAGSALLVLLCRSLVDRSHDRLHLAVPVFDSSAADRVGGDPQHSGHPEHVVQHHNGRSYIEAARGHAKATRGYAEATRRVLKLAPQDIASS